VIRPICKLILTGSVVRANSVRTGWYTRENSVFPGFGTFCNLDARDLNSGFLVR
jgi:hypothetical protein